MQVVFRLNGNEEIGISNQSNGLMLEIISRRSPVSEAEIQEVRKVGGLHAPYVDESGWIVETKIVSFSKSQARAVASAMMGAASEM